MKRNVSLDWLQAASIADVAALPPEILADLDTELSGIEMAAKARRAVLDAGMVERYGAKAASCRGEPFGTAHLDDGEFDVKFVTDKRVDWDQAKLIEACRKLEATGQDATEYVTTEIKVAENRFKAWPTSVQVIFAPARTTKPAKPRITLTPKKKAAA
jgi:hypothetical protein